MQSSYVVEYAKVNHLRIIDKELEIDVKQIFHRHRISIGHVIIYFPTDDSLYIGRWTIHLGDIWLFNRDKA